MFGPLERAWDALSNDPNRFSNFSIVLQTSPKTPTLIIVCGLDILLSDCTYTVFCVMLT